MVSVISLIREGDILGAVIFILSGSFVVFVCSPIHELAHGWVAYKLGDNTAKREGRLTFNPIAHIDPIGMILILLFGFGFAKAVPVNMNKLKNPKRDMALVSVAGPASNLVLAFISVFIYYMLDYFLPVSTFADAVLTFFYYSTVINVTLAVFNLIPIPPLDGSKILASVLPNNAYYKYMQYERYAFIALLVLVAVGALDKVLGFLTYYVLIFIQIIPSLIFG